jgi:cupin fold WbuC family metalloprotein
MPGFERVTASVFETAADPAVVTKADIATVIAAARLAPNGRARLLLHAGRDDSLHEMVIALPPDSCDHPHINFKSGKSFLALSGQFAVMRFSNDGSKVEPVVLSATAQWHGAQMLRLRAAAWHTIIPLAGDTVFLETIIGPFEGNRFAPWFSGEDNVEARMRQVEQLRLLARAASRE